MSYGERVQQAFRTGNRIKAQAMTGAQLAELLAELKRERKA